VAEVKVDISKEQIAELVDVLENAVDCAEGELAEGRIFYSDFYRHRLRSLEEAAEKAGRMLALVEGWSK
jgi:hypothetical protein